MRLSDLLNARALTPDGRDIGQVRDIRFVHAADTITGPGRYIADGIIISRHAFGARLGLVRPEVKGPWLLKVIEQRLHRHATWVPISAIASLNPGRVNLKHSDGTHG